MKSSQSRCRLRRRPSTVAALVILAPHEARTTGSGHLRWRTLRATLASRSFVLQATQRFSYTTSSSLPSCPSWLEHRTPTTHCSTGFIRREQRRPRETRSVGNQNCLQAWSYGKPITANPPHAFSGTKRFGFPPLTLPLGSSELDLTPSSRPAQYRPSGS